MGRSELQSIGSDGTRRMRRGSEAAVALPEGDSHSDSLSSVCLRLCRSIRSRAGLPPFPPSFRCPSHLPSSPPPSILPPSLTLCCCLSAALLDEDRIRPSVRLSAALSRLSFWLTINQSAMLQRRRRERRGGCAVEDGWLRRHSNSVRSRGTASSHPCTRSISSAPLRSATHPSEELLTSQQRQIHHE